MNLKAMTDEALENFCSDANKELQNRKAHQDVVAFINRVSVLNSEVNKIIALVEKQPRLLDYVVQAAVLMYLEDLALACANAQSMLSEAGEL